MTYALYLFDLDGTLADWKTHRLLPGVYDWFKAQAEQPFAVCSNQGGVGYRADLEARGAFDRALKYPTEASFQTDLRAVRVQLPLPAQKQMSAQTYLNYTFCDRRGNWSPVPRGREAEAEWQRAGRKPAPGMLLAALAAFHVVPRAALMVGDRPEDLHAAEAAGVHFEWAHEFFERLAPEGWSDD
jgi:phosphoglycolate phosphatase-like HAD superfamily hydrolase